MPTADPIYPDRVIKSTYDECVYSGTWTANQTDNSGHNTSYPYATTSAPGSSVTITPLTEWTDMVIFTSAGKSIGVIDVYVDGMLNQSVDCYILLDGSNVMRNAATIRISVKTRGIHTVKLVCSANKNAASSSTTIGLSHIYVMDPDTPTDFKLNAYLAAGDSITDSASSYADKWLKRLVNSLSPSNKLRWEYATRPGVTSQYVARWIENELFAKRISIMTLLIGTNDLPQATITTKDSIQHVIDVCSQMGVELILCTIPPRNGLNAFSWNRVNGVVKELAAKNNLLVADFNTVVFNNTATTVSPVNSDGIHPDQVGHSLMAKVLFDTLLSTDCGFRLLIK